MPAIARAFHARAFHERNLSMSGFSSTHTLFTRRGAPLLLATGALGAALLAGCGGGGGNGNIGGGTTGTGTTGTGTTGTGTTGTGTGGQQANADVTGKITDAQGNGVAGATIVPDSGGTAAVSLGQGGYRLNNLTGNVVHRLTASVQQGNTQYTGSTEVLTEGNFVVSNANIIVSPTTRQARVGGTVRDPSGNPLNGAQVSLALPTRSSQASSGNYSSLIAFTDANGSYTIPNIPSDMPSGGAVTISVSIPGAQTQTTTLTSPFQPGDVRNQDFTISGATGAALAAPTLLYVTTATEPTDSQSGRAIAAHAVASPASVYDQLRRRLCPAYARTADRHAAVGKRLAAHDIGDYAIETDVAFDPPLSGSLLGYYLYRDTQTTVPTENEQYYDFLLDPLANYYTNVSFSTKTDTTVAGTQYNFAISALNSNNPPAQSPLSSVLSITPLGRLILTHPTVGQTYIGSATITWSPATGAQRYVVFVYDQYPTIGVNPITNSPTDPTTALPAGSSSYTVTGLGSGQDYYVVVVGVADPIEDLLPTPTSQNQILGGAQTFSQITRLHIQ